MIYKTIENYIFIEGSFLLKDFMLYSNKITLFDNKVTSKRSLLEFSRSFFAFPSHVKLCLKCFGLCTKNKVLLYFIHKVKFYKDKVIIPILTKVTEKFLISKSKAMLNYCQFLLTISILNLK